MGRASTWSWVELRGPRQECFWQFVQSVADRIDRSAGDQRLEEHVSLCGAGFNAGYVHQEPLPQCVEDQVFDIAGPAIRRKEGVEPSAPVVEGAETLFCGHPPRVQGDPRTCREGEVPVAGSGA